MNTDNKENDFSQYNDETYEIIGACFEVQNEMGSGFVEQVYQECLEIELAERGILFVSKKKLLLTYKDVQLEGSFIPDFICFNEIIMEIKAVRDLADEHRSQVLNYLSASGIEMGMLINFGHYPKIEYERIVNSRRY